MPSRRDRLTFAFGWNLAERFGSQFFNFIVTTILARLLLPSDFGVVAIISSCLVILQSISDNGLNQGLIRNQNASNDDYSSVFWFSLLLSTVLYLGLFFVAPKISIFFGEPQVTVLIRVLGLKIVINSFTTSQQTRLIKEMNFKKHFLYQLPWLIIGGLFGIIAATRDFGVWSLVIQQFVFQIPFTIHLWVVSKWKPVFKINRTSLKSLHNFGVWLFLADFVNNVFEQLYVFVIGKSYSVTDVGYYNRAQSLKQLPINNISSTLNKVSLPLLSEIQENMILLKSTYKKIVNQTMFLVLPIMVASIILADNIFVFLFTDKWLAAVPTFQWLCLAGVVYPLNSFNLNILKVTGRSKLFFRLEVLKKILQVLIMIVSFGFGFEGLIIGQVIFSFAALILNSFYSGRLINYSLMEQTRDTLPVLVVTFCMAIVLFSLKYWLFTELTFMNLLLLFLFGTVVFFLTSFVFKLKALSESMLIIKSLLNK